MILKFKTRSGQISELPVEQLLEIDGVPFAGGQPDERLAVVEHRVSAIEDFLAGQGESTDG